MSAPDRAALVQIDRDLRELERRRAELIRLDPHQAAHVRHIDLSIASIRGARDLLASRLGQQPATPRQLH